MPSVSHSRFFRESLALLSTGIGLLGECLGLLFLVGAVTGHGSTEGNILVTTLGLSLLAVSSAFLVVGTVNFRRM
jgi:hypothetical protein